MHCMIKIMYIYDEFTLLEDTDICTCSVRVSRMNKYSCSIFGSYIFFHFDLHAC